ncbi:MAG: hypothetical protein QM346_20295 [Chloroflexota bacterium]|nr:hypothetical protein [Chloroflexota bacterium]
MKSYVWMTLLIIAALSLTGCGPATVSAEPEAETAKPVEAFGLGGTFWTMSALDGDLPVPGSSVTLEFGGDGPYPAPMAATTSTRVLSRMVTT